MPFVHVGEENSGGIDLYYEDHGKGKPVVLIHGWPLSGASWEKQLMPLLESGHRVVTYDRRGFGRSDKPAIGYDYDVLAADLDRLLTQLDLREVTLVGFSMGGGEVARYLGSLGTKRVRKAVFMAAIPPFLLKTPDNPEGVDGSVFEGIQKGLAADRPAFLAGFLDNFYNADALRGNRVSDELVRMSWSVAVQASPQATLDCVQAWLTDFRKDLSRIDIPTLVVHGDDDRIVPLAVSGRRTAGVVKGSRLAVIPGGPHGLNWTHAEEVNREMLAFLKS
jgi:pimeloyl-ACP methyl ester carboxylesterase